PGFLRLEGLSPVVANSTANRRGEIYTMRSRQRAVVALIGTLLLAGAGFPSASAQPPRYIDLDKVPEPKITGAEIIAGLEDFVERFPMRQQGMPNNIAASEFLAEEAKGYGFETRILEYEVEGVDSVYGPVRVVEAVKRGTKYPDEWIALVAHYDIVPGAPQVTIQGAYDDGSGTNMLRFFAKAFSKLKMKRSIAILWFDGEENGRLGSQAYAAEMHEQGQKFAAVFGFDMVGIGYPAPYCMCVYHGRVPTDAPVALPVIDYVNFDFLEFPEGDGGTGVEQTWPLGTEPHVCSCGPNPRNSDEQSFGAEGYFSMRWTGMKDAADYPGYHQPWDTVPLMELVAGDRETLEAGSENVFVSAYYTTFVIDNLPYSAIYPSPPAG
ncbi:MAG TPA: M28 family peptidase, partial [Actinomycetota bacterium]|nr:M28 family peptidase [Actinomycetota bacterium]